MSFVPDAFLANSEQPGVADSLQTASWQRELANAVRTVEDLLRRLGLNPDDSATQERLRSAGIEAADSDTLRRFPVLVPENFLARMQPGDVNDPLLLQVLPQFAEGLDVPGFVPDAVGDMGSRRVAGVLQKYAGRVLLIATSACAIHCRYCFRRDYPYAEEPRRLVDWQPALDVIATDASITEVIFSGGDPLMLNDARLLALCSPIDDIPHVERIRFHTRMPIVLPSRVTPDLLSLLTALRTQPIMVVHANHANELVGDCASALKKLVRAGMPVLNQAVLLAGVNDRIEVLESLCRRLINLGVMPYYLHQLDRVSGTAHFEADREQGRQLIEQLAARLPGYAVPRFVQEIPGESSKTPL